MDNQWLAQNVRGGRTSRIFEKTGITERHISAEDECASDLGCKAAQKLFQSGQCDPEDIDFLLFCTQTPDHLLPATACLVQERLGLKTNCGALDFSLGCSGFVYGLALAKGLIETGTASNVLLITAETYSKLLNPSDLSVRAIFGDAAAATLVSGVDSDEDFIGPFVLGTDGSGAQNLIVPAGGMRRRASTETAAEREMEPGVFRSPENLYMNGPEIFAFTIKRIPKVVRELLSKSNMTVQDVDLFVFHQASLMVLDHLRKKINVPDDKFVNNLGRVGNTVSSTIPMAMEASLEQGRIGQGARLMLVGFGVGYSWGAVTVRFP